MIKWKIKRDVAPSLRVLAVFMIWIKLTFTTLYAKFEGKLLENLVKFTEITQAVVCAPKQSLF